jgi:ACR3 family arsenite efflux pump ArsB
MVDTVAYNATTATTAMASLPSWGTPVMAVLFFILIAVMLFCLYKNFRRIVYGLAVLLPAWFLGWISWGLAKTTLDRDMGPLNTLGFIAGGILVSSVVGALLQRTKSFQKFEKGLK